MKTLNISIAGITGRMGRRIADICQIDETVTLIGGFDRHASNITLTDGTALNVTDSFAPLAPQTDILIDFTTPIATLKNIETCQDNNVALIIGTTGFTQSEEAFIISAGKTLPLLKSGNMSLGVNLLAALVKQAAARLSTEYDIEIFEAHHRHKVDSPSGTALLLGEAAAQGRNVSLQDKAVKTREGITDARKQGDIGFSVLRAGGIIGDHDVSFGAEEEILTLSHRALDRRLFAKGAVAAAKWICTQGPGYYTMQDMLNL